MIAAEQDGKTLFAQLAVYRVVYLVIPRRDLRKISIAIDFDQSRVGRSADVAAVHDIQPACHERIVQAGDALEEAARGDDASKVHARIQGLDDATKAFAGRRMNRAIARAIEGRRIDTVEKSVEHARGIDEAHAAQGPLPATDAAAGLQAGAQATPHPPRSQGDVR